MVTTILTVKDVFSISVNNKLLILNIFTNWIFTKYVLQRIILFSHDLLKVRILSTSCLSKHLKTLLVNIMSIISNCVHHPLCCPEPTPNWVRLAWKCLRNLICIPQNLPRPNILITLRYYPVCFLTTFILLFSFDCPYLFMVQCANFGFVSLFAL